MSTRGRDDGDGADLRRDRVGSGDDGTGSVSSSVSWTAGPGQEKTALFVETSDGWILDHVREVCSRKGGVVTSDLDSDVTATGVPGWVVDEAGLSRDDLATTGPATATDGIVATDGGDL
jgi:hypothetical protein